MSALRRSMYQLLLALLPASSRLAAQCPDGSPPPCRRPAAAPRVAIDSNAIAILPFRVSGPPEAQYLGEGMLDLLNIGLDGFAGWRVLQPKAFLRQLGTAAGPLEAPQAARLARAAGAAAFVLGSVATFGPDVVVQAGLYGSAGGRPLATARARGSLARPAPVADSIAASLARYRLAQQPGVARRALTEYTSTSPAALQAYLVAEQLARGARWPEAVDSLSSAISRDSTFALAYYALYRALSWGTSAPLVRVNWGDVPTALTLDVVYEAAQRHRERTPIRQRRLLEAVATYNKADVLRLIVELTQLYPDDADVALETGDAYFHIGLPMGEPPSRALERLERAIALDPGVPEAYLHAVQLRCISGDTAGAWQTLDRLRAVAPTWAATSGLELGLRAALRGEDPAMLLGHTDLFRRAGRYLLWALDSAPARAVSLADAFTARVTDPAVPRAERVEALLQRHLYHLAQGRYGAAWERLREATGLDAEGPEVLGATIVHHLATGGHAVEAAEAARQLAARGGARPLWAAAVLGWRTATFASVDSAQAALPSLLAGSDWPAFRGTLLSGLTGLLDARRGDSVAARRNLTRGNAEWVEVRGLEVFFPNPYFALVAARLDRAAGDLDLALGRLHETMATLGLPFRADAEELRGQIAAQRGDMARAIRAYGNFIELWQHADPELQPRVTAARAAIERLRQK